MYASLGLDAFIRYLHSQHTLLRNGASIKSCRAWFIKEKFIIMFMIFIISVHCDGTGSLNSSSWKTKDLLSSLVKISRMLMTWHCKEQRCHQPWYWSSLPGIVQFHEQKGYHLGKYTLYTCITSISILCINRCVKCWSKEFEENSI